MASKKQLAPEVQAALDEINGLKPSRRGPNFAKTGESVEVKILRPTKVKRATGKTKALFNELAKEREQAVEKMDQAKETKKRVEERLHKMVLAYGRPQIDPGKAKDLIFYADPFKGELSWSRDGGAIDTEKVAEKFPELIDPALETLNLSQLEAVLQTYEVPESTKALVTKFRAIVMQLQKATELPLIEMKDDRLLDIEKYEQYKQNGKITPKQVEDFESNEGHYSLRVHKLSKASRCSSCGHPRPKRSVNVQKHTCTRCGQTE